MSIAFLRALALAALTPALAHSQQIPIRILATAEAVSKDTIGAPNGVRELSDGRVVVNDANGRRLIVFDKTLSALRVLADSVTGSETPYGKTPTGIIPYFGDSTLLIDPIARAFLVFDAKGEAVRVMSPPRPSDLGFMWNPSLGTPRIDARGGLVYRSWLMPSFHAPEPGKPVVPPEMPDSAPILRGDFDRRVTDTLAWVRIAKMRINAVSLPGGGVRFSPLVNPLATIDDWTVLPDGTIAMLRGQDYHIDWINADGSRWSSPRMPFDWKRLSDAEKSAIVDSTKALVEREARSGVAPNPMMGNTGPRDASGMPVGGHSMTVMPVGQDDGNPRARSSGPAAPQPPQIPEVVAAKDLPDYMPPLLRPGTMKSDMSGNVWLLPSTSVQSGGGLLYDIVNRKGEVYQRVRLPVGRSLEGFGADGAVYLLSHDASGARLERFRLH